MIRHRLFVNLEVLAGSTDECCDAVSDDGGSQFVCPGIVPLSIDLELRGATKATLRISTPLREDGDSRRWILGLANGALVQQAREPVILITCWVRPRRRCTGRSKGVRRVILVLLLGLRDDRLNSTVDLLREMTTG